MGGKKGRMEGEKWGREGRENDRAVATNRTGEAPLWDLIVTQLTRTSPLPFFKSIKRGRAVASSL